MERALCASPEWGEGVNSSLWWVLMPESSQPTVTVKGRTDTVLAAHTQESFSHRPRKTEETEAEKKEGVGWGESWKPARVQVSTVEYFTFFPFTLISSRKENPWKE